jgi:hypothetical protein
MFWETLKSLDEEAHNESEKMKEWVKELVPTYTIDKRESAATQFLRMSQEKETQNQSKAE